MEAFTELLEKYRDTETNPAAEPLEKLEARMAQDTTDYYLILCAGAPVGAARVQRLAEDVCRVSPVCILPAFQGKGFAQGAMRTLEALYPQARTWRLDTIREEEKLCRLYEKLGYRPAGREEVLQPGMQLFIMRRQPTNDRPNWEKNYERII